MTPARHIAVLFDPDEPDLRRRGLLPGIARYAAEARNWHWAFDPHALRHPACAYDGIIAQARQGRAAGLARAPVPLVCVNWAAPREPLTLVVENRYAAARLAVRHLLERRYATFAYLGFGRLCQFRIEREAFRRELARFGRHMETCRPPLNYAQGPLSWHRAIARLDGWLDRLELPAGVFVCRPGLARILADVALGKGLRIPQDVGIIAADDEPALCELPPALTSIHFDYAEVGYRAAQLLDRLIERQPPPDQSVLIKPTLVPRLSTDREALADPLVAKALWFIDSRRAEPIRVRDVAQSVGLAPRTLEFRFRRAGRGTVRQELARARVEHAKIHLEHSRGILPAIAHDSGFANYQAMLRAFNQHVGIPPSAWRRQALLRRRGAPDAEQMKDRRRGRGRPRRPR